MSSCLDVLNIFLKYPHPILSSMVLANKHIKGNEKYSVIDDIANILGIKDKKNINNSAIFLDIGLDSLMATEIKQLLEINYNLILTIKEIRNLTFKKLQEIQNDNYYTSAELPNNVIYLNYLHYYYYIS